MERDRKCFPFSFRAMLWNEKCDDHLVVESSVTIQYYPMLTL